MSLLSNQVVYKPLLEDKYIINLLSFAEVPGKDGKENYVELQLQFPDGRIISQALFGERALAITLGQLDRQLRPDPNAEPIGAIDLLTLATQQPIEAWVTYYRPDETKAYRNIHFQEPIQEETPASSDSDTTEEDF